MANCLYDYSWRNVLRQEKACAGSCAGAQELGEKAADSRFDLVPDRAYLLEILTGRVIQLPILIPLAWIERAGVSAAHRDDHVRLANGAVGKRLRRRPGEVDALLGHRLDCYRIYVIRGLAARGENLYAFGSQVLQKAGGHLAATGVVDADEQNCRSLSGQSAPSFGATGVATHA
jgi:hypothetical protein